MQTGFEQMDVTVGSRSSDEGSDDYVEVPLDQLEYFLAPAPFSHFVSSFVPHILLLLFYIPGWAPFCRPSTICAWVCIVFKGLWVIG